jgi:hypothetical protein
VLWLYSEPREASDVTLLRNCPSRWTSDPDDSQDQLERFAVVCFLALVSATGAYRVGDEKR